MKVVRYNFKDVDIRGGEGHGSDYKVVGANMLKKEDKSVYIIEFSVVYFPHKGFSEFLAEKER